MSTGHGALLMLSGIAQPNYFIIFLTTKRDYMRVRQGGSQWIDNLQVGVRLIPRIGMPPGRIILIERAVISVEVTNLPGYLLDRVSLEALMAPLGVIYVFQQQEGSYFSDQLGTVRLIVLADMRKPLLDGIYIENIHGRTRKATFLFHKLPRNFCPICRIIDHSPDRCKAVADCSDFASLLRLDYGESSNPNPNPNPLPGSNPKRVHAEIIEAFDNTMSNILPSLLCPVGNIPYNFSRGDLVKFDQGPEYLGLDIQDPLSHDIIINIFSREKPIFKT